jgi:peptidyl-prolyl cis-trans isomerase C
MVKEFDQAVFSGEVGKVLGPVRTQFGYHMLEFTSRTE